MMRRVLSRIIFSSWRSPIVFLVTVVLGFLITQSAGLLYNQYYLLLLSPSVCALGGLLTLKTYYRDGGFLLSVLAWFGVCVTFLMWDVLHPQFIYYDCFVGCDGPQNVYWKLLAPFSLTDVVIVGIFFLIGIAPIVVSLLITYLVIRLIGEIRQLLFSPPQEPGSHESR